MIQFTTRAEIKGADAFRGYSHIDTLNLRLFNVASVLITSHSWRVTNVCSSYWRFYSNDREGARLIVYGAQGEKHPFNLEAGACYLVPSGVRFDCECVTPSIRHFYAHFEVLGLPGILLRELFSRPLCLPQPSEMHERSSTLVAELLREGDTSYGKLSLLCRTKSLLYDALAVSICSLRPEEQERHQTYARLLEPVLPALGMIEEHFADPLTNRSLANSCCLSEDYFIRRFKECVGESPAQYIQRRRIESAANRLLFSTDSIEQIAVECGFGNRFYFTRAFSKRLGIAPAAYRKEGKI